MNSNTPIERQRRIETGLQSPEMLPGQHAAAVSIEELMEHYLLPGCSLAIIDDGRIVTRQGYGVTEQGGSTPIKPSTIFQACSISKAVAAVGAMRLVQEGLLALDEDVNDYLSCVADSSEWRLAASGDVAPSADPHRRSQLLLVPWLRAWRSDTHRATDGEGRTACKHASHPGCRHPGCGVPLFRCPLRRAATRHGRGHRRRLSGSDATFDI